MAMPTPEQASVKWEQGLASAYPRIKAGVNAVTSSPTAAAAAKRTQWLAAITASATRWAARLNAVSLQEWKDSYSPNLEGIWPELIGKSTSKYRSAAGKLFPILQNIVNMLPARTTNIATNCQRVTAIATQLNNAKNAGQLDWR